jgi:hypothetical protein
MFAMVAVLTMSTAVPAAAAQTDGPPAHAQETLVATGPLGRPPTVDYLVHSASPGLRLEFFSPMVVQAIEVPTQGHELWPDGRVGEALIVKSGSLARLGVRDPGRSTIRVRLPETITREITLVPVLTGPAVDRSPSGDSPGGRKRTIAVFGISALRHQHERNLARLAAAVVRRNQRRNCFSCHEVLPLAFAIEAAQEQGLALPEASLASLTADLGRWQRPDGTFSFATHPSYGVITPTLCAGFVLSTLAPIIPAAAPILLKTARALPGFQRSDGRVALDFTFPTFLEGEGFPVWALVRTIGGAMHLARRRGFPHEPELAAAWLRSRRRLLDFRRTASIDLLFLLHDVSLPLGLAEIDRQDMVARLTRLLEIVTQELDPEARALAEGFLVRLGKSPRDLPRWPAATGDWRYLAWRIVRQVLVNHER